MNHIKNERGEVIIACGSENSPIRIATTFPDSLASAIFLLKQGTEWPEIWAAIPNVKTADKYYFHRAVMFYLRHKELPV